MPRHETAGNNIMQRTDSLCIAETDSEFRQNYDNVPNIQEPRRGGALGRKRTSVLGCNRLQADNHCSINTVGFFYNYRPAPPKIFTSR